MSFVKFLIYFYVKVKNNFLTEQIQLYCDKNELQNEHITMINTELNK